MGHPAAPLCPSFSPTLDSGITLSGGWRCLPGSSNSQELLGIPVLLGSSGMLCSIFGMQHKVCPPACDIPKGHCQQLQGSNTGTSLQDLWAHGRALASINQHLLINEAVGPLPRGALGLGGSLDKAPQGTVTLVPLPFRKCHAHSVTHTVSHTVSHP